MGLVLSEIEERAKADDNEAQLEFNLLIHSHQCFSCSSLALKRDCLSNGTKKMYCAYEAVNPKYNVRAPGADSLLLSLKMRCLSEQSPTPAKTFFRFVTLFFERGCMGVYD